MVFLLMIPTAIMALSDFRSRKITLWSLLLLFALCLPISIYLYGGSAVVNHIMLNIFLLAYLGVGILLYLWIRHRRFTNPLKRHLGSGDLLFVLALTPLFDPEKFLIFLLASMVGALAWWMAGGRKSSIPLVGILGIAFGIYLIII